MKKSSISDSQWNKMIEKFKRKAIKYDSIADIGRKMNLDPVTVRKILDGRRPSYLTQLKIEGFVHDK